MKNKHGIELSEWTDSNYIEESSSCSDGWRSHIDEVDGLCKDCGYPTVGGDTASGCNYSPVDCKTCGHTPCDQYC